MFETQIEELKYTEQLINQGQYLKALDELKKCEEKYDLTNDQQYSCSLLRGNIYLKMGGIEAANEIAEAVQVYGRQNNNPKFVIDAIMLKANSLRHMGKFIGVEAVRHPCVYTELQPEQLNTFTNLIDQSKSLFTHLSNITYVERVERKAWLTHWKGVIYRITGELEASLQSLYESLEHYREIKDYKGIADVYQSLALTFGTKGEINREIIYLERALKVHQDLEDSEEVASLLIRIGYIQFLYQPQKRNAFSKINQVKELMTIQKNQEGLAVALGFIGNMYTWEGDLETGLSFLKQSLEIAESVGNREFSAFLLNNIGWNYHNTGQLDLASDHLNKSLAIAQKEKYPWIIMWIFTNLGFVCQAQGNFEEACSYYEQSIMISEQIGDYFATAWALYQKIKLNLDMEKFPQAKEDIERLKQFNKRYTFKSIDQMYRVAKGMLQNQSVRIKDKAQALQIFEEVSREEIEIVEITADAMINQFELLLFEYKISNGDKIILGEINLLSNQLLEMAHEQISFSLLSRTYLLKAKLSILEFNFDKARRLLSRAQQIAEEKGLNNLARIISREHDVFTDQLSQIEQASEDGITMNDLLEIGKINEIKDTITSMNILTLEDLEPEIPVMLIILVEGGMPIYTKMFTTELSIKDRLVGSFLAAINAFSTEVFSSAIERLTLGEYRIVVKIQENLTFAYVFKGESYPAIKKLSKLIKKIQNDLNFWQNIERIEETGMLLQPNEENLLHNWVASTFKI